MAMNSFQELVKNIIVKYSSSEIVGNPCSDKGSNHAYEQFYPDIFDKYKDKKDLKILEIGISIGYSLKMWAEIFPNAQIYGMDQNYSQLMLSDEERQRFTFLPKGCQTDKNIFRDCPLFDIIIDDGSHIPVLTLQTWFILKDKLSPNGIYIIEDVDLNNKEWSNKEFKETFELIDLRNKKNRHDDVLYIYNKPWKNIK